MRFRMNFRPFIIRSAPYLGLSTHVPVKLFSVPSHSNDCNFESGIEVLRRDDDASGRCAIAAFNRTQ